MIIPESENLLERVRIASPCSMSWDAMKGDDKKRFCNHCNLHVYNISAMTRSEAEDLIRTTEGRLCARFYRRADGTVLTQDCPVGLKQLRRRLKMRVGAFASMLFGFCLSVFGQEQKNDAQKDEPKFQITRVIDSANLQDSLATIKGTVFDENEAVVVGVIVTLTNEKTKQALTLKTDETGSFAFQKLDADSYLIQIKADGFRELKVENVNVKTGELVTIKLTLVVGEIMGLISVEEIIPTPTNTEEVKDLPITVKKSLEPIPQKQDGKPVKPKKPL